MADFLFRSETVDVEYGNPVVAKDHGVYLFHPSSANAWLLNQNAVAALVAKVPGATGAWKTDPAVCTPVLDWLNNSGTKTYQPGGAPTVFNVSAVDLANGANTFVSIVTDGNWISWIPPDKTKPPVPTTDMMFLRGDNVGLGGTYGCGMVYYCRTAEVFVLNTKAVNALADEFTRTFPDNWLWDRVSCETVHDRMLTIAAATAAFDPAGLTPMIALFSSSFANLLTKAAANCISLGIDDWP